MDSKDFKKMIEKKLKEDKSFNTWLKNARERGSRPRITRNIIQPETENAIDSMYGYYDSNCVVHDDKDYT